MIYLFLALYAVCGGATAAWAAYNGILAPREAAVEAAKDVAYAYALLALWPLAWAWAFVADTPAVDRWLNKRWRSRRRRQHERKAAKT